MKLFSTLERHTLMPAVCPQTLVRSLSPISLLSWQESALVPAATEAALATEPVRALGTVLVMEPGGRGMVRTGSTIQLDQRGAQVQGTNGFDAKHGHSTTAPKPNGGVRGIPPRGRPV